MQKLSQFILKSVCIFLTFSVTPKREAYSDEYQHDEYYHMIQSPHSPFFVEAVDLYNRSIYYYIQLCMAQHFVVECWFLLVSHVFVPTHTQSDL